MKIALTLRVLPLLVVLGPPAHAQEQERTTFSGVVTYFEEGPSAVPGGLMSLIEGAAMPIYLIRVSNVMELLTNLPGLQENPTMQNVSEMLNKNAPIDLGTLLPISSVYWANIEFRVVQQDANHFRLESGTLEWSARRSGELTYEDIRLREGFGGRGHYMLDPQKDRVDLVMDFSNDRPTFTLDLSVEHPMALDGDSLWQGPAGTFRISLEAAKGVYRLDGSAMGRPLAAVGFPGPLQIIDEPFARSVGYVRRGTYDQLKGIEVWRTVTDSTATVSYEIFEECSGFWLKPDADNLTFDEATPGKIEERAQIEVTPEDWGSDLLWTFPEIKASRLTTDPEDKQGWVVDFEYLNLPTENDAFGDREFAVEFQALKERCDSPEPKTFRILFPREAENNPDGDVPNWYYYWQQTRAAQGHRSSMTYDSGCENSEDSTVLGHFDGYIDPAKARTIYICDLANVSFNRTNPLTFRSFEGIDVFGSVVLHEWTHLENYWDWWGAGGYREALDRDEDLIPDDREAAYGLDPLLRDTLGLGFKDCEYPAYLQDNTWPVGAADKQDWADPGKQSGGS